jgi:hypothetical protein
LIYNIGQRLRYITDTKITTNVEFGAVFLPSVRY